MRAWVFFIAIITLLTSCRTVPNSDRHYDELTGRTFKLHLTPDTSTKYSYAITNESRMVMEIDNKSIENESKADVKLNYQIRKDTNGNLLMNIKYDKVHIYTKSNDLISDKDADDT